MAHVARFFLEFVPEEESCGKCVPCRVGTKRMLEILNRICSGQGKESDVEQLIDLGEMIKETSLCGLGQTAETRSCRRFAISATSTSNIPRQELGRCVSFAGFTPLAPARAGRRRHPGLRVAS